MNNVSRSFIVYRFIKEVFIKCPLFLFGFCSLAQQVPDMDYNPKIENPAYQTGNGPTIYIDEGHYNFHTKDGRYAPFAKILERDGYEVKAFDETFNDNSLKDCEILVIANPLNEANLEQWTLPNPSAFTEEEITAVEKWVKDGGRLFLIIDHMPWPGASEQLAKAFGFEFINGFNVNVVNPAYFWRANQTIAENIITAGRDSTETVYKIPMTEGQAFKIPSDAKPILTFDYSSLILLPTTAWEFNEDTPIKNIGGLSQGAFKTHGKGRIVVFGEASMFSAQIGDPGRRKMGMNNENAQDNYKLLLNVVHWLDGLLN